MRFLYILGNGSRHRNIEIKYSLRSVAQFYPDADIIIVGERPDFVTKITHIAVKDAFSHADQNAWLKIEAGARKYPGEFVLMNDDFFLLRDVPMVLYQSGDLGSKLHGKVDRHSRMLQNTHDLLKSCDDTGTMCFDVHFPIPMIGERVLELIEKYRHRQPLAIRSLYGNLMGYDQEIIYKPDMKISYGVAVTRLIDKALDGKDMFSIGHNFLNKTGIDWLRMRFPKRSPWEK